MTSFKQQIDDLSCSTKAELDYIVGFYDARHASAEIAQAADARIAELEAVISDILAWGLAEPHDPAMDADVNELKARARAALAPKES